jgi:hypothetical protein
VPSYRRETRLAFTLDALVHQTLSPSRFEVIIVRDGGSLPSGCSWSRLNVRNMRQSGPGPSTRRNRGWRAARGQLVAFTDDDCRPAPGWLETMLDAYRAAADEGVILQGRTAPDPDELHLLRGLARTVRSRGPNPWFPTCNLAIPRRMLERLEGFDERFAFHCEDTELGLRAEALGARLIYVDDAVVWHAVHPRSLRAALRDAGQRHGEPKVVARHPRQRDALYMGLFVNEEHARVALAGVGLLFAVKRPLLAALTAYPYMVRKLDRRLASDGRLSAAGFVRLVLAILAGAIVDGAEVVMRLRASAHERTLVL